MDEVILCFGWCWILAGLVAGAIQGMFFHHEAWLGGYGSWARRMTRLGHIAFMGTALISIAFALTVRSMAMGGPAMRSAAVLLMVGAVAMPTVCYLSAWRKGFRHLFFVPVTSLGAAVAIMAVALVAHVLR